ncbi:MAG: formate--tetrahydrofolate ligase, partial [Candidatus Sericytochromatia bacterium]
INGFYTDTEEELNLIKDKCKSLEVECSLSEAWAKGGAGTTDLAEKVVKIVEKCNTKFTPLYDLNQSIEDKIRTISQKIYGAEDVDFSSSAITDLAKVKKLGLENLPVCIAKTQKSLSDNPKMLGKPENFRVTVRELKIASGAGFIVPIMGEIIRMPGLPENPAAENIDIDENENIIGIF